MVHFMFVYINNHYSQPCSSFIFCKLLQSMLLLEQHVCMYVYHYMMHFIISRHNKDHYIYTMVGCFGINFSKIEFFNPLWRLKYSWMKFCDLIIVSTSIHKLIIY